MHIEYIGHACFVLKNKEGVRIMLDPYNPSIGLTPVSQEADILLISHHHYDHDCQDGVSGNYRLYDRPGVYEDRGIKLTGVCLPHDDAGGSKFGTVVAFLIETDGMRTLHMGDVGALPDDAFYEQMGKVDILMLPVGGNYTIDAAQAVTVMDRVRPNITIPMHYKTTKLKLDIASAHGFVKLMKKEYDISHLGGNFFEITADNLKKRGRVLLMENSY